MIRSELILKLQPSRGSDDQEDNFFEGVSGDDLAIPFQLVDENGAPVNIRAEAGMSDIVAEFTSGNGTDVQIKYSSDPSGVNLVDGESGRGQIIVLAATCATLATSNRRRQTFSIYTVVNGLQTTWIARDGLLLHPRPVPAPQS